MLHNALCVLVAEVVAVIHALSVLINRETLGRLVCVVDIVARGGGSCFGKYIATVDCRAVRQSDCIGVALNLRSVIPFLFDFGIDRMNAYALLFGLLLGFDALLLFKLSHGCIMRLCITLTAFLLALTA